MSVEIRHEDHRALTAYAEISNAYEIREVVYPLAAGNPTMPIPRISVSPPRRKDYDSIPGNHPRDWRVQFGIERARFLAAFSNGQRVGGAVVVVDTTDALRLGGIAGLALLWDLRVAPHARGKGVGQALLLAAEGSAQDAGARGMVIETQNINVAACDLYARTGYRITKVDGTAYPELPGEVQVTWAKTFELSDRSG